MRGRSVETLAKTPRTNKWRTLALLTCCSMASSACVQPVIETLGETTAASASKQDSGQSSNSSKGATTDATTSSESKPTGTSPNSSSDQSGSGASTATQDPPAQAKPCVSDGDCTDPTTPACDPETKTCIACVTDKDHCLDPLKPVCGVHEGVASCQACFSHEDCADKGSEGKDFCALKSKDGKLQAECVKCVEDAHCTDAAAPRCATRETETESYECRPCDMPTGQCPGEQTCLWLGPGQGQCTSRFMHLRETDTCEEADGSLSKPYCSFSDYIKRGDTHIPTTLKIHVHGIAPARVNFPAGARVSITADSKLEGTLVFENHSEVSISGLEMDADVYLADHTKLSLYDVQLEGESHFNASEDSTVFWSSVSATVPHASRGPIVSLSDSNFFADTAVIANQTTSLQDATRQEPVFRVDQGSIMQAHHMTIANNVFEKKMALFRCHDTLSTVSITDSIILHQDALLDPLCQSSQMTFARNFSDSNLLTQNGGALLQGSNWHSLFRNPAVGDYGLAPGYKDATDSDRVNIRSIGQWSGNDERAFDLDDAPWTEGLGYVGADQGEL